MRKRGERSRVTELIDHELQTFSVPGRRQDQQFLLSRFQIGQAKLVGAVGHVPRGSKEKGHSMKRKVAVSRAVVNRVVDCIKQKG